MSSVDDKGGAGQPDGDTTEAVPKMESLVSQPGAPRPCVVFLSGARLGEIIPVDRPLLIGRDASCEIRIVDDEGISRRHFQLLPQSDGVLCQDLDSHNGTFIGDQPMTEALLEHGDKIRVGQTTVLRFCVYDRVEEEAQRSLLESALRVRVLRERSIVVLDVGPASEPNTWFDSAVVMDYLGLSSDAGFHDRDYLDARYTRNGPCVTLRFKFDQTTLLRNGSR